ncbi:BNR-4 repeat-containing protein [Saccharicrinis sp. FJH54]|uniref:BNR-4 repeat-containing protein n=1 Tax=Saccharicrinis sp. FJH54 TaxID=3344665 RepID=UPI0035D481AD
MRLKLFISSALFAAYSVLSFAQTNLVADWDGNGDTDQSTSYPDQYGWAVIPGEFNYANSNGGVRYMDVSSVHTLDGSNYIGRLMMIRWDGAGATTSGSVFSYPVNLEQGKRYNFSWIYEWWNNGASPTLTVGISKDKQATVNETTKDFTCSPTRNVLLNGEMDFSVSETGTYYITITGGSGTLCALGELSVKEIPPALNCSVSSLSFNNFVSEAEISVYPNGSADIISIDAPADVTVNPAELPAEGGTLTVSSGNSSDFSGDILISQGDEQITVPVTGTYSASDDPVDVNVVAEEGAWCWFADPRALHYENESGTINNTYIGYIDVHGAIKATQVDHLKNESNEVLVRSYFQPDDHDNPTFLVLPDERIMIFYTRHTDEACFYYRISQKPGDITTLGREVRLETSANTTYPSPFIMSDDPDHIYICWRGINWHPTIGRITIPDENDDASFDWGPKQIVQSTAARPYAKYASNGKDKIYMTYTTGHPDNEAVNYVYFNYIDINDMTLHDISGSQLSSIENGVHNIAATTTYYNAHPNAVVDNSPYRNWVWEVSMDDNDYPVIAMVRISNDKSSHDYYYARWTGSAWQRTFLENGGGHFHQSAGLEECYSGGMALDDADPDVVYCSVPVDGNNGKVYELKKYTVGQDGTLSAVAQVTGASAKNNVRPYVIPGSGDKLVWMNGDYYDWIVSSARPEGFATGIRASFDIPHQAVELEKDLIKHETFDTSDGFTGDASVRNGLLFVNEGQDATFAMNQQDSFTIVLSPYVDHSSYYGELLTTGNLTCGLAVNGNTYPYIKIAADTYTSSNVLGSSDVWQTQSRGTGGNWPTPTKFDFFSLAFTYGDGVLKTYINGLLDQYIEVDGLMLSDITIGGFTGAVDDLRTYSRVLSQDEIKNISAANKVNTENKGSLVEFGMLTIPEDVYTDIVLPDLGNSVTWSSSNTGLITNNGLVNLPEQETTVVLTATPDESGLEPRTFNVTVHPRSITHNKMLYYGFEASDVYTSAGIRYVTDKTGNGNDAAIYGSAAVNGVLDLSANTNTGFSTNGYAVAPAGLLDNLRSYTFVMKVNPVRLENQPRIYDFGTAASNSVFARLNTFVAGLKYNGGTTVMINSSEALSSGMESGLAFTYDAKSGTTKIYVDGEEKGSSTSIQYEPYQLVLSGSDNRNYIGRTQWWDSGVANDNADYCGTVDDFYLFDIALTSSEIKSLEQATSLYTPKNNLISVYPNPVLKGQNMVIHSSSVAKEKNGIAVKMLNMEGQILLSMHADNFPLELKNEFDGGVYFVRVTTDSGNVMQGKFIVR